MTLRPGQLGVVALGSIPALVLGFALMSDSLGANPIEELTHETGEWALRLLLLTLAVSPLHRLAGLSALLPYRRTFGLLCFAYACLHLATYVTDVWFDLEVVFEDLTERPYIIAGATAFLSLLPLAVTSSHAWIRRLGPRWRALHRLAYVAAIAAVVHFYWLVKADVTEPLVYAGVLAALLGARVVARQRARGRARAKIEPQV